MSERTSFRARPRAAELGAVPYPVTHQLALSEGLDDDVAEPISLTMLASAIERSLKKRASHDG